MRSIGMDVHRSFAQVAICDDGKITDSFKVDMEHDAVLDFGRSLQADDEVVLEATGNTATIVRLLTPFAARAVIANPLQVSLPSKIPNHCVAITKMCSVCCVTSERVEMTKKPYEDSRLAKYIERRALELKSRKSQSQIASEAGFPNPNMVTMIKRGTSKLALDRVPSMARALECDPAHLMGMSLEQAVGGTAARAILEIFGTPVTANEEGWLQVIRDASGNTDPRIASRSRTAIRAIFGK